MNSIGTLINSSPLQKLLTPPSKHYFGGSQLNNEIKYIQLEKEDNKVNQEIN
jgi:hypothetical protein